MREAERVVAAGLVVLAGLPAVPGLAGELRQQSRRAAEIRRVPRDHGLPIQAGFTGSRQGFIAFVRSVVPSDQPVRIVQQPVRVEQLDPRLATASGRPGVCGSAAPRGAYWWLVYTLVPRASTCDPAARWSVYYGIEPPASPAGRLFRYGPGLAVVRRP